VASGGPLTYQGECIIRFWGRASHDPEWVALVEPDGTEITAGALLARVNQIVHGLRAEGIQRGDAIAVSLPNCKEWIEIYLAAMQAGWYVVPVNNHLTAPETSYLVADSGAKIFVAHARNADVAGRVADDSTLPTERLLGVGGLAGFRSFTGAWLDAPSTLPVDRTSGALMYYTSGTTGRPKGVRRPIVTGDPDEGDLLSADLIASYGLAPGTQDVHLCGSPLYHTAVLAFAASALHFGHTVVLMDGWQAEKALDYIQRFGVTHTHMVPTQFRRLLLLPDETRGAYDCSSLTCVVHGAAPCEPSIKQSMMDWWGPIVWEYYGTTEGGGTIATPEQWLERPGTVGSAYPGADIRILDDDGIEVARGDSGTVYFHVAWSDFEYHNDPDKTSAGRRGDYCTVGDLGRMDDDGFLYLLGRSSELIITNGINVYPAEIEGALIGHPGVADVAVIGHPDADRGEIVYAFVEPAPGRVAGPELEAELMARCRERLAPFKLPRVISFVTELPRDPNGKLLKRRLSEAV
jgi:long-chain acyl-CoA synthetase